MQYHDSEGVLVYNQHPFIALFKQEHLSSGGKFICYNSVQIDTCGNLFADIIPTIPFRPMISCGRFTINQSSDKLTLNVVYFQCYRAGVRDLIG